MNLSKQSHHHVSDFMRFPNRLESSHPMWNMLRDINRVFRKTVVHPFYVCQIKKARIASYCRWAKSQVNLRGRYNRSGRTGHWNEELSICSAVGHMLRVGSEKVDRLVSWNERMGTSALMTQRPAIRRTIGSTSMHVPVFQLARPTSGNITLRYLILAQVHHFSLLQHG